MRTDTPQMKIQECLEMTIIFIIIRESIVFVYIIIIHGNI